MGACRSPEEVAARSEGQRVWEAETRFLQFEDEYETATVRYCGCTVVYCLSRQLCCWPAGTVRTGTACAAALCVRQCSRVPCPTPGALLLCSRPACTHPALLPSPFCFPPRRAATSSTLSRSPSS
jgi:hypothetical protein